MAAFLNTATAVVIGSLTGLAVTKLMRVGLPMPRLSRAGRDPELETADAMLADEYGVNRVVEPPAGAPRSIARAGGTHHQTPIGCTRSTDDGRGLAEPLALNPTQFMTGAGTNWKRVSVIAWK